MPVAAMAGLSAADLTPHDLVWLSNAAMGWKAMDCCLPRQDWPAWISPAMLQERPLVVRRDHRRHDAVPVGVRGSSREQRFAAWVSPDAIRKVVTPTEIAARRVWRTRPELLDLKAIQVLDGVAGSLDAAGILWGVTGSAGFTLACDSLNAMHGDSDLDLLVNAAEPMPAHHLAVLAKVLRAAPVRIDIQVATPLGGFALLEYLRSGGRVLLKTASGPRMYANPWQAEP